MQSNVQQKRIKMLIKSAVSLCFAFCVLIACFIVVTNNTKGWFANNRKVDANGMDIEVATPEGIEATVTFHEVLSLNDNTLSFNKQAITPESGKPVSLPQYDVLDEVKRHLLVKISLSKSCTVSFNANTDTKYFMDSEHLLLGSTDGTGANYNNCMTSIIDVTRVENVEQSGEQYQLSLPLQTERKSFAKENDSGAMEITPSINLVDNKECQEIFILISYNDENINRVYSANIGNEIFKDANLSQVVYVYDFSFEIKLGGQQ